jgi:hypothetical protein
MREDQPQPDDAADASEDDDVLQQAPSFIDGFMSVVVLRPREPFLEWVARHLPGESVTTGQEAAASAVAVTPELPRAEDQEAWLRQYGGELFARQLAVWAGEDHWPPDRSLETLRTWFDVEFVPAIDDLRHCHVRPEVTCAPVSLAEVVDQFESIFEDGSVFVDVSSGAVLGLSENELEAIQTGDAVSLGIPEGDLDTMRRAYDSPTLVEVMSRGDFDELSVMASFAESQPVAAIRNRLIDALRGRKPFRRFKDAIDAAGVRDKWFAWREDMLEEALRLALDDWEIPYVDDPPT